jgi:hypothetical protein
MFVRHALIMGSNSRLGIHLTQGLQSLSNSQSTGFGKCSPSTPIPLLSHLSSSLHFHPILMTSMQCIYKSKTLLRNSTHYSASLAHQLSTQIRLHALTRCTMPTIKHHYSVYILCSRPFSSPSYFPKWISAFLRKQAGVCRG